MKAILFSLAVAGCLVGAVGTAQADDRLPVTVGTPAGTTYGSIGPGGVSVGSTGYAYGTPGYTYGTPGYTYGTTGYTTVGPNGVTYSNPAGYTTFGSSGVSHYPSTYGYAPGYRTTYGYAAPTYSGYTGSTYAMPAYGTGYSTGYATGYAPATYASYGSYAGSTYGYSGYGHYNPCCDPCRGGLFGNGGFLGTGLFR
jgi:hypothetical protein